MISQRRHQWRSLAGGELSEEMYGRVGLPRHAIGLKRCYNTKVTPQGALENRAGTKFISTTKDNNPAWLIPFVRSDGQGFLLEFTDSNLRVFGSGNLLAEETDPGDTFTVSGVDIWVPSDSAPIVPVLFTTSAAHGFSPGSTIQFQGFTLANPDAAGTNIMQGFMNTQWYVATTPTTTTFTITKTYPFTGAEYNFDFESADADWTLTGNGTYSINSSSPVDTGTYSAKLSTTDAATTQVQNFTSDALIAVKPSHQVTLSARLQAAAETGADHSRMQVSIIWYSSAQSALSQSNLALDATDVSGFERITSLGLIADAASSFTTETLVATAPANAYYFKVFFKVTSPAATGATEWTIDNVVADFEQATWEEFSYSPYLGLVNPGTVALLDDNDPIELSPTYTQSHIRFASYAQFVDDLIIAHPLYQTARVRRVSDNEWQFSGLTFNAAPTAATITHAGSTLSSADDVTETSYYYALTTVTLDGVESDLGTPYEVANSLRNLGTENRVSWPYVTGVRYNVYKSVGGGTYGFMTNASKSDAAGTVVNFHFDNHSGDTPVAGDAISVGSVTANLVEVDSAYVEAIMTSTGDFADNDSVTGPGFTFDIDGDVRIGVTDNNIAADFTKRPPEAIATFDSAGNYPGVVCFHEQRMILASTPNFPQSFFASGLPAFDYFKSSSPPQDDQAFAYELASVRAAPIVHSLALNELLFFTSAGVFRVPATNNEAFTPGNVASIPVAAIGAHELAKPQEHGTSVLFPGERGGHVYKLSPEDSLSGYSAEDMSVIAAHLIDGDDNESDYDWVQTAMQRSPYPVWYGLRNDGVIIGFTFMPEQQVFAWHQHELPGAVVESIAVVPEGKNDALYVVAQRTVNGNEVRYIERVEPRKFGADQANAYFVDAGVTYRGPQTATVTGLDHLEGLDVMALANGRVVGPLTVASGAVTLDDAAEVIHVGIGYNAEVETLPLAYESEQGYGVGIEKNLSQVWMRLKQSLGLTAGPTFDDLDQKALAEEADELLGGIPALRSGVYEVDMTPSWDKEATVCIRQTQPLPFTLTGLAADYVDG